MIELALRNFLIDTTDGYTSDATRQANRVAFLAAVGSRIYAGRRPQSTIDPALTIERVGVLRFDDLKGEAGICQSTVQCAIWGKESTIPITVVQIAEQYLRGSISQYRGAMDTLTISGVTVTREGMVSRAPDDASDIWAFTYSLDFLITHSQAEVLQPV